MIHSARFYYQQVLKEIPDEAAHKDPEGCLLVLNINE
jgi:hypothetical protein